MSKYKDKKKSNINIWLPEDMKEDLIDIVKANDFISLTELVRVALGSYINRYKNGGGTRAYD